MEGKLGKKRCQGVGVGGDVCLELKESIRTDSVMPRALADRPVTLHWGEMLPVFPLGKLTASLPLFPPPLPSHFALPYCRASQ